MRILAIFCCAIFALGACKKDTDTKAKTTTQTAAEKAKNDSALSSLTAEQQAAVRVLVRDTLVSNPDILLEAQQAFEAKQIREQNERVATAYNKVKSEEAQISFGPSNAKITIIEYFDYKCGFCHAALPWINDLMEKNKDYRFIFKELPILTPNSTVAAKAAMAAHSQGKYLEFHRALMAATGDLNLDQIMQIAQSVGLDTNKLRNDMNKPQITERLEKIRNQAAELGITGTPGFIINGKLVSGFDKQQLETIIGAESQPQPTK